MNLKEDNLLVSCEITYILIGSMIGVGIFSLPNVLAKDAYESAWISAALGAIYPLYLGGLAIFMSNKHPKENILVISKKYFGKSIGTLLNSLFLAHFIIYASIIVSGFNNVYRVYVVSFLTPIKIVTIITFIAALTAYRGLKVIARINTLAFYLIIILVLTTLNAFKKGSYLNLLPILDVPFGSIIKSVKESFLAYGGFEIIFLIYPSAKNPRDIKKAIFKAIAITGGIYALVTLTTIYYLSVDIIGKNNWSLISIVESVNISIVNNFRFVFAFMWIGIILKVICNYYLCSIFIAKDLFKNISRKTITVLLYIIVAYISIKLCEDTIRKKFIDVVYSKLVIFVTVYPSIIALFVFLKKDGKCR